jgi:heterogeneous nuclear rnp K-like protein 2
MWAKVFKKKVKRMMTTNDLESSQLSPSELDISVRAIVTTKEAGVVIGKEGKSVSAIREVTGVKVGVSKVIPGVHERILTVSGPLPNVSKAFALIAENLLESMHANQMENQIHHDALTIRCLVSHQLVGSVIGKSGSKIREIQDESGAKIVVSKDMLPQSTERIVEVYGVVDSM